MIEIQEILECLKDKINKLENKEYKEIFGDMNALLEGISNKVEETLVKQESIEENIQFIDEDLTDLQDELFEEVSLEDLEDFEDEYVEIKCNKCNKPLFVEKEALENNKSIPCPFCNENSID
ncbi:CD1247 N-terminal domain-containing protein [Clostridium gasigenes]|uniref:Uncharacterized protein n=1 Tax=Clostridium gasigenes TaxID=94869 RepID=A0A1H0MYZ7_9CLOT|nr:CD1247 N-terminal domain-containing protein [Clostridium gasigenes]SDO85340.1 hypothetical protein SAMN04488529_101613 [Clostridium gasigenes]